MSLETGKKIESKVVAMLPNTGNVIQWFETLGQTQHQPFIAPQMIQYEWRPGHAVAADVANIGIPDDDKNLLVPDPFEQQHIAQDTNPFSILENDEDIENEDDKAQQVLPDQIENQGAEDTINAKQNYFKPNPKYQEAPQEDQGALKKVHGARKNHGNRGARIEVVYPTQGYARIKQDTFSFSFKKVEKKIKKDNFIQHKKYNTHKTQNS